MKKFRIVLFLVAIPLLCGASAQAKTITLAHSFQAGQIDKYAMSMDIRMNMPSMPGMNRNSAGMKMSMTLRQKVLGILPDGSAKVLVTCGDFKVTAPDIPGGAKSVPQSQSMTLTVDREGRVLAVDGMSTSQQISGLPGFDPSQLVGQMGFMGVFPREPIAVGESWESEIPMPYDCGGISIVSTLVGAAVPLGKQVASKIKQTYQGYLDLGALMNSVAAASQVPVGDIRFNGGMQMTGWTVLYFAPQKGKLLKANGQMSADLSMDMPAQFVSQGAPQSIAIRMDMNIGITKI